MPSSEAHYVGREQAGQTLIALWHPRLGKYLFRPPKEIKILEWKMRSYSLTPSVQNFRRFVLSSAQEVTIDPDGNAWLKPVKWGEVQTSQ